MSNNENDSSSNESAHVEALFEDIRAEIALFDQLDLTDVHPAIVFNPLIGTAEPRDQ